MNLQEAKDFIAECTCLTVDDVAALLDDEERFAKLAWAADIVAKAEVKEREEKRVAARAEKARQEREWWDEFYTPKPRPEAPGGMTVYVCPKCNGSGRYCSGILNGRPTSGTGFTCWNCEGVGYKFRKKRGAK